MSARTPFIPNNTKPDTKTNGKDNAAAFQPESSNPLHSKAPNNVHEPLNIGNLISRHQTAPAENNSAAGLSIPRPDTAAPAPASFGIQSLNHRLATRANSQIFAPVPRQASNPAASLLATQPNERLNSGNTLSMSTSGQPSESAHIAKTPPENTHIPNALGLSFAKPQTPPDVQFDPSLNAGNAHSTIRTPMAVRTFSGPQRVRIQPDTNGTVGGQPQDMPTPRNINGKRRNSDMDDYANHYRPTKMPRSGVEDFTFDPSTMVATGKALQHDTSPSPLVIYNKERRVANAQHVSSQNFDQNWMNRGNGVPQQSRNAPTNEDENTTLVVHSPKSSGGGTLQPYAQDGHCDLLSGLLGRDTDSFVSDYMEQYEKAVAKWRECSLEEWMSGADEITAKYVKILDFVKTYMTNKMKALATLEDRLDQHQEILKQREQALTNAKNRLVQESGNVLGGK